MDNKHFPRQPQLARDTGPHDTPSRGTDMLISKRGTRIFFVGVAVTDSALIETFWCLGAPHVETEIKSQRAMEQGPRS